MKIQYPPFKENRQFGRVRIPVPTKCLIFLPQFSEFLEYPGIIKNISLGGIYFVCEEALPIKKGDVQDLIFDVLYNDHKIYRLIINAFVVRIEKGQSDQSLWTIALKFLSEPIYCSLEEINYNDFSVRDKIRLLYQHYRLFRKAVDTVQRKLVFKMDGPTH